MKLTELNAQQFKDMVVSGAQYLTENVELINSLNVFPVPDGDTGTNMNMTFVSGCDYLVKTDTDHIGQAALSLAKGLLMGARGNSGVILSQIFRGFSQAIKDMEVIDAQGFVAAFAGGVESAYKAVMKPVEGTILTVAREAAIAGDIKSKDTDNIIDIMQAIVDGATVALDNTPNQLPVLKQVGVVDSGGKGLLCVYEGFLANLTGERVISKNQSQKDANHAHAIFGDYEDEHPMSMEDITYGFCTEIMVRIDHSGQAPKTFDEMAFKQSLDAMGDSLLVVADDEIVKVHVHTEDPGKVMQMGQEFGELIKIKVDNMREQVRDLEGQEATHQTNKADTPSKAVGLIAVAAGQGMVELFESMGVDYVLEGGQTMNPSTEDFAKAIEHINAESFIILPNNKNIVMAAEQASQVMEQPIEVVKTTNIPQGIAALVGFNPEADLATNAQMMTEMSETVVSGQITYAIRDTEIDGVDIHTNDYMGIVDGKIKLANPDLASALEETLLLMLEASEEGEIVTIFVGEDGEESMAEEVSDRIMAAHPDVECDIIMTDQPVYHFLLSVE